TGLYTTTGGVERCGVWRWVTRHELGGAGGNGRGDLRPGALFQRGWGHPPLRELLPEGLQARWGPGAVAALHGAQAAGPGATGGAMVHAVRRRRARARGGKAGARHPRPRPRRPAPAVRRRTGDSRAVALAQTPNWRTPRPRWGQATGGLHLPWRAQTSKERCRPSAVTAESDLPGGSRFDPAERPLQPPSTSRGG